MLAVPHIFATGITGKFLPTLLNDYLMTVLLGYVGGDVIFALL